MPVQVVMDHPHSHSGHRLSRSLRTLAGAFLVCVGLLVTLVGVPAGFALVLVVVDVVLGGEGDVLPFETSRILLVAGVSLALNVALTSVGLRLMRANRELVLLLRRFGYGDATSVATYAAEKTIGKSWRLVTLDDASAAPVGVPAASRRLLRGVSALPSGLERAGELIESKALGAVVILPLVIAGVAALRIELLESGESYDPYIDTVSRLASGHVPFDAVTPSLVGAFAVSIFALALVLAGVALFLASAVILMVMSGVMASAESASEAAESAEQSKELSVENAGEIDLAVNALAAQSRMVLAPRLVVMRVATSVWQPTVQRLATAASLTIVDVSESTENLLWEIRELRDRLGPRCVFVGERARVTRLTDPTSGSSPVHVLDAELSRLLDGHEVLAYTTDARGKRRFARALRSKLLEAAM